MAFKEDFDEFLDESQGFAEICTIIPSMGSSYKVKGIFSSEYIKIDIGYSGISSSNPIFECQEELVSSAQPGDLLRLRKQLYRVVGIKPDGLGWIVLELEKQG